MQDLLEVCCGLDVHKEVMVACLLRENPDEEPEPIGISNTVTRCKKFFLRDWFYRLRARRGTKKALIAVAGKLLAIVWHVLTTGEAYDETRYKQMKKNEEERSAGAGCLWERLIHICPCMDSILTFAVAQL